MHFLCCNKIKNVNSHVFLELLFHKPYYLCLVKISPNISSMVCVQSPYVQSTNIKILSLIQPNSLLVAPLLLVEHGKYSLKQNTFFHGQY